MKKTLLFILALVLTQFALHAQFDEYKYIVVPIKFDAFKNQNEYKTSTLTKYLIAKEGFNVVYDNAMPDDLNKNRCLGAYVDLVDNSSLFSTKLLINVKDCEGNIVFTTEEGRTKIKEYNEAYKAALNQACNSFIGLEHNYLPKEPVVDEPITVSFKNDVKSLDKPANEESGNQIIAKVVEHTEKQKVENTKDAEVLYAQPTANGYQLVDTTPAVRYRLEATSVDTIFLVNQDNINGVVLKKDGRWFLEYKGKQGKVVKELHIKF
ncbi:hypothetical protein [uncultured Croceitalea sp.]|uniref:hypothetical protein n=1 Tax=uncultured Croceitalea sp. TaxID=1798908 RepID=UPI0033066101